MYLLKSAKQLLLDGISPSEPSPVAPTPAPTASRGGATVNLSRYVTDPPNEYPEPDEDKPNKPNKTKEKSKKKK